MFKLNENGFPIFEMFDPKKAEEVTKTAQQIMSSYDPSWFFKMTGNPFEPEYVEDKNLEKGDYVNFLDADGEFFCKATIIGLRENNVLVQLEEIPGKTIVVRREDLQKMVKRNDR